MKWFSAVKIQLCVLLMLSIVQGQLWAETTPKKVTVSIIHDGEWRRGADYAEQIKAEILALTEHEFDVRFPADKQMFGGWRFEQIQRQVSQMLADPAVDIVIGNGLIASHTLVSRQTLPKPSIATIIIDTELQNTPLVEGKSGVKNLNYLVSDSDFERALQAFYQVARFQHLGVVIPASITRVAPGVTQKVRNMAAQLPFQMSLLVAEPGVNNILRAIPGTVDAVMLAPDMQLTSLEVNDLSKQLIAKGLASFSLWGREEVELGFLMSTAPQSDLVRFARRVALNVQRILLGEDAGNIEVTFQEGEEMTLNMATAKALGIWPTWAVLTEAELLNEDAFDTGPVYDLAKVLEIALQSNIDLDISKQDIAVGVQDIRRTRSNLLPQIKATYQGRKIDRDRARASFGLLPEYQTDGNLVVEQAVLAEPAWAALKSQKLIQESTEWQHQTNQLDVALLAAQSFLGLLQNKTLVSIFRENLKLTRSNLDLARKRELIGTATAAEVYRWESEIATNKRDVINAQSRVEQSMVSLNRILRQPQKQRFRVETTNIDDPLFTLTDPRIHAYLDNPWTVALFKDFMSQEAIENSKEIRALNAQLKAQKRQLLSAQRAFYWPTLGLNFDVNKLISRDGEGASQGFDFTGLGPQFTGIDFETDNVSYTLAFQAELPLYTGAKRRSEWKKASETFIQLQLQRDKTKAQVEERIRNALNQAEASYTAIELNQEAADAAQKNLDLTTDAYARGALSIVELLDAQNATFTAKQNAANSVYAFLSDLMEVQRALGQIDYFTQDHDKEAWYQKLDAYFMEQNVQKPIPVAVARSYKGD